jgi:hypothetical protein
MNIQKEVKLKISWGYVSFGILLLVVGGIMISQGIEAYKTGTIVPATSKSGPMTGLQSVITGILAAGTGTAFLGYEVLRKIKRNRN